MIKETEQTTEQQTSLESALKEHRLAAKLSIHDVAQKLNLKASVVRDMEGDMAQLVADDVYQVLYLRGYVTNYARLIGLSDLSSFSQYQQFSKKQKPLKVAQAQHVISTRKNSAKLAVTIIILIALLVASVGVYLFFSGNEEELPSALSNTDNVEMRIPEHIDVNHSDAISSDTEEVEPVNMEDSIPVIEATSASQPTEGNVDEAEEVPLAVDVSSESEVIASLPEQQTLTLKFKAECWTEVFDATGKRLTYNLYQSGRELTLAGIPPFNLKLGNPLAVDIFYQDQLVEREFKEGGLAHFNVPEQS